MIIIRSANEQDIVGMAEVHKRTWQTTYVDILPKEYLDKRSLKNSIKGISEIVSNNSVFTIVAEYNNKIIGFASGGDNRDHRYGQYDGEVFSVYILQEHARQGLGKRMFKNIVKSLQKQGKNSIIVWMLKGNSAEFFYKKMSGVKVAEEVKNIGGIDYPIVAYAMKDINKIFDC